MGYTDDLILNRLVKSREDNFGEPDDLIKAMNKAGLVQKEVQVRGKNGQIFMRKQWVKASEDVKQPRQVNKLDDNKQNKSNVGDSNQKIKAIDANKFFSQDGFEKPTTPKDAYYAVEAADTDHGGLKVGNSVLTVGGKGEIYQIKDGKKSEISPSDALKIITSNGEKSTSESYAGAFKQGSHAEKAKKEAEIMGNRWSKERVQQEIAFGEYLDKKYGDKKLDYADVLKEKAEFKKQYESQPKQDDKQTNSNTNQNDKQQNDKSSQDLQNFFSSGRTNDVSSNKKGLVNLLTSGHSRDDIMSQAEASGITWKKSDHPGINWMRASMAITGTTTRGNRKNSENTNSENTNSENTNSENTNSENTNSENDSNKQNDNASDRIYVKSTSQKEVFKEAREFFKNNQITVEDAKKKVYVIKDSSNAGSLFAKNSILSGNLVSDGFDDNEKTYYDKIEDTILQELMSNFSIEGDKKIFAGKDGKTIDELRPFLGEDNTVLDESFNGKPIVVKVDEGNYLGRKLGKMTSSNGMTYDIYEGPNDYGQSVIAINKLAPKKLGAYKKQISIDLCVDDIEKSGIMTRTQAEKALKSMGISWDKEKLKNYMKDKTPNDAEDIIRSYGWYSSEPKKFKEEVDKLSRELQVRDWMLSKIR